MKPILLLFLAFASMSLAQSPDSVDRADDHSNPFDAIIPQDPIAYYAGLREALSDLHEKGSSVKGYLQTNCKLSNEDAFRALEYLIHDLADSEQFRDKDDRFQAICCIRDYPCEEAYAFLERLLVDEREPERRTAACALTRMSLDDSVRLARLQEFMSDIPTENWARQEVYQTISTHLQYGVPSSSQQRSIVRFLLNRVLVETQAFEMLDETLCREVPKWRASPQRAENAAKMIREHPDDMRLVAFFETVRTNALETARTCTPPEHTDCDPSALTNQTTQSFVPSSTGGLPADSDPWADLLDNLPEKKPRVPPPDSEPPL